MGIIFTPFYIVKELIKYSCCKCRKTLFTSDDIVPEHSSDVKKFNATTTKKKNSVWLIFS